MLFYPQSFNKKKFDFSLERNKVTEKEIIYYAVMGSSIQHKFKLASLAIEMFKKTDR